MNVVDWCSKIFQSETLEAKMLSPDIITDYSYQELMDFDLSEPGRSLEIQFSKQKIKFPKVAGFRDVEVKAKALAFFANHELEAIEMMCAAIIKFGNQVPEREFLKISRGIVSSIKDEQRHLKLYLNRINDFGSSIDRYPLNDFFWKQFSKMNSFDDFFALMSLTLEAANLDFCLFYEKVFRNLEDEKTAKIMREVYNDELNHVKVGIYWLNKWRDNDSLWDYYWPIYPRKSLLKDPRG